MVNDGHLGSYLRRADGCEAVHCLRRRRCCAWPAQSAWGSLLRPCRPGAPAAPLAAGLPLMANNISRCSVSRQPCSWPNKTVLGHAVSRKVPKLKLQAHGLASKLRSHREAASHAKTCPSSHCHSNMRFDCCPFQDPKLRTDKACQESTDRQSSACYLTSSEACAGEMLRTEGKSLWERACSLREQVVVGGQRGRVAQRGHIPVRTAQHALHRRRVVPAAPCRLAKLGFCAREVSKFPH